MHYPLPDKIVNHIQSTGLASFRRNTTGILYKLTNTTLSSRSHSFESSHKQRMATAYKNEELNAFTLNHYNTFIYLHTNLLYYTAYSVFCYNVRLQCPHETLPRREYLLFLLITFVALMHHRTSRSSMPRRICLAQLFHSTIPTSTRLITLGYERSSS
jgi:hypothetical protein